jgi:hypothetical protein
LQVKYEDAIRKKTEYENKVDECNQRILRAERVSRCYDNLEYGRHVLLL